MSRAPAPGKELDALLSVHVMGWGQIAPEVWLDEHGERYPLVAFSTLEDAAFRLVYKLQEQGCKFNLSSVNEEWFACFFHDGRASVSATAPTVALAISYAALRASYEAEAGS